MCDVFAAMASKGQERDMNFDNTLVNAPVTADREPDLPEHRVPETKTHAERDYELFEGGLGI
jgi:hypothetical protein